LAVKKLLTGVIDTSEYMLRGVNDMVSNFLPVSLTPAKHRNSRISLRIKKKNFEIVSGQVYWAQEEQFDEKNQR
jgi:hypothetical protein